MKNNNKKNKSIGLRVSQKFLNEINKRFKKSGKPTRSQFIIDVLENSFRGSNDN